MPDEYLPNCKFIAIEYDDDDGTCIEQGIDWFLKRSQI